MKLKKVDMRLTKRDVIVLAVLLALAVGFAFWQLLLSPMLSDIDRKERQLEEKKEELRIEELKRTTVLTLRVRPDEIISEITQITDKYLPDNSIQFYFDLINNLAAEAGLKPSSVQTRLQTSSNVTPSESRTPAETTLVAAINEYDAALHGIPQDPGSTSSGSSSRRSRQDRYTFKYIPITVEVVEGNFAEVQNFIQSINDLENQNGHPYSMYFSNANIRNNDKGDVTARFEMYFISIDRLSVESDELPEDMIYEPAEIHEPAEREDVFYYPPLPEDVEALWLELMTQSAN